MTELVSYRLEAGVATLSLDDGKANVMSPAMIAGINAALDRASADRAAVLLTGRTGTFSGGFDLGTLAKGGDAAYGMLMGGFELAARLLAFPAPVVVACSGHALAMGCFLLQAADYRIGIEGPFKIGANETAIGLNLPALAIEICRQRLAPAHFNRVLINAEIYSPQDAVAAGLLDAVVEADQLMPDAQTMAARLARYGRATYATNKQLVRAQTLKAVEAALAADRATLASLRK